MQCIVTAGPTFEPLDQVRRLTNFSTGRLGAELARSLARRGRTVRLLLSDQATYHAALPDVKIDRFTTTADLRAHLQALAGREVAAVFHAAAVSDFTFGKIFQKTAQGKLRQIRAGKISSRLGPLLVELRPTPKIIAELRDWFPRAWLVGWKYEVDGGRTRVLARAREQLRETRTDLCVANGPAYGKGFGCVTARGAVEHFATEQALFASLARFPERII